MRFRSHHHSRPVLSPGHPLAGKTLYIPAMEEVSARAVAAAFRWLGVDARVTPPSDARTLELGNRFTEGDECYPAKVTFGDLLRLLEQPGFDPRRTAFLMTSASGPCRFGQYAVSLRRVLDNQGYPGVQIVSPHDKNGYADFGGIARPLLRTAWRAVVGADTLRRLLLKTKSAPGRPTASMPPRPATCAGRWNPVARSRRASCDSWRIACCGRATASAASRPTTTRNGRWSPWWEKSSAA